MSTATFRATQSQAPAMGDGDLPKLVSDEVSRRLCEFDDRTSPEDQPDMMLVTADELEWLIREAFENNAPTPTSAPSQVVKGEGLDPALMRAAESALSFSASRNAITADHKRQILATLRTHKRSEVLSQVVEGDERAIRDLTRAKNPPPDVDSPEAQIEWLYGIIDSALYNLRTHKRENNAEDKRRDAIREALCLVEEFDIRNSDWGFRRGVLIKLLVDALGKRPTPIAVTPAPQDREGGRG